jgi:hypothetical protein
MAKVNLTMNEKLWQAFRIACIESKTSASKKIADLMQEWLAKLPKAPRGKRDV